MKLKFLISFLLAASILIIFRQSFAKNIKETDIQKYNGLIRVGISTNDFGSREYKEISFTSFGSLRAEDKGSGDKILETNPNDILKITIDNYAFNIYKNDKKIAENYKGSILIKPESNYFTQIIGLTRKGTPAAYRGVFEVAQTPFYSNTENKTGKFSVINVLPVEEYLRGVVPNELPVSFGLEALKAQAVAARNYAIRPRTKSNPLFDVCDSVQSQVYFGANTEKPLSDQAIKETEGLLALYDGETILALYSSTAGGYTESYENAFSEAGSEKFPANPRPYLKGKPDIEGMPDLSNEENAKRFYTSSPSSFDVNSGYYRWTKSWTEEDLRKELNQNLSKYANSSLITPSFVKGTDIGKIKKVEAASRGVSGKIIELLITAENGTWSIKKELLIRRIMTNKGKALPSANVVFNNYTDKDGNLIQLNAFGGGFGHGVGMSQYGAGFMSKNGYTFDKILQHYYDGISLGTAPFVIDSCATTAPISQRFYSSTGKADLILENEQLLDSFTFEINSKKIKLDRNYLPQGKIRMPLDNFAIKGLNEIVFYPLDGNWGKSIKVRVEVFKSELN